MTANFYCFKQVNYAAVKIRNYYRAAVFYSNDYGSSNYGPKQ